MRILIVNKYYFLKGGVERYIFTMTPVLESHGHTVVPLAIRFARNRPTPYAHYFLDPPVGEDAVQLEQFRMRPSNLPRMVMRAFYSAHAKARLREVIRRERIDIVYAVNISNYISPSIIDGAHAEGVPIIQLLGDFNMVCANAMLSRPRKYRCYDCIPHKYWHGIIHRCVGGSLGASIVRCLSMFFHDAIGVYRRIDGLICPTPFMRESLLRRGIDPARAHLIPYPIDCSNIEVSTEDDGTLLYFGRVSKEKAIDTLVEAAKRMPTPGQRVLVIGEATRQYGRDCIAAAQRPGGTTVEFLGPRYGEELWQLVRRCRATIVPSRWTENAPFSMLESLAHGKPVIGSNVDGISAVIRDGTNGLLFEPDNPAELAAKMGHLAADPDLARRMGLAGRRLIEEKHSPERHYERLINVFEAALAHRRAAR